MIWITTDPASPLPYGTSRFSLCYDSKGVASFPVTITIEWHPSGKKTTVTFTGDSCQPIDVEPGSYGATFVDESGQSEAGEVVIET